MTVATPAGQHGMTGRYGGFVLGALQLALPMQALREVVPQGPLLAMPCPMPAVLGGIDLRGVLMPVLDLRRVLGLPTPELATPTVVVMVHDGRILGLLADGITGVFDAPAQSLHAVSTHDPVAAVLSGTVRRTDIDVLVNILSPHALSTLPQVPMVDDPEPERQQRGDTVATADEQAGDDGLPMLLVRTGQAPLAIDALAVHATLSEPQVLPSVLAQGLCAGVIEYGGRHVGVLDLAALCGLPPLDNSAPRQAFVLRTENGDAAMLVEQVVDIVRCSASALVPVPTFALPRAELFKGALPASALPADVAQREAPGIGQYLVLDPAALKACTEVVALTSTNTDPARVAATVARTAAATPDAGADAAASTGSALITFQIQSETATPIEQVQEILPFSPALALFKGRGPVLGLMSDRGRSIPVVCLSRLLFDKPVQAGPAASVLVVDADGLLVGFAVPSLRAIERSDWQPEVQAMAQRRADATLADWPPRHLARVGQGDTERMLPVVRLVDLARTLRQRQLAA